MSILMLNGIFNNKNILLKLNAFIWLEQIQDMIGLIDI